MGRRLFLRNNALVISAVVLVIGLVLTVLAYTAAYPASGWNAFYENLVPSSTSEGDWNLLVRVVAPIVLLVGIWYVGEQLLARRKFNRLMGVDKKSDFSKNVTTLTETAKKLPKRYEEQLQEKERSFKSRR